MDGFFRKFVEFGRFPPSPFPPLFSIIIFTHSEILILPRVILNFPQDVAFDMAPLIGCKHWHLALSDMAPLKDPSRPSVMKSVETSEIHMPSDDEN